MYVTHFGLRFRPFRPAPDPAAYYPASAHESALQEVQLALTDGDGLALVTGDTGTGKSLLATVLVDRIGDQSACVFVTNGHLACPADLYQAVLYDLGEPYEGKGEQELRLALTDSALRRFADGRKTVLMLDEAHHLSPNVLEEVRLLGNLETRHGKAVQSILFALPEIEDALRRSDLRAFRQRLTARANLFPLPADEAADYVIHQLRIAGARPDAIISDEAVGLIARATGGVPRLLNQTTHLALALTCEAGEGRVDVEGALEALARLGLESVDEDPAPIVDGAEELPVGDEYRQAVPGQPPRLVYRPGLSG